jgi:hypothetical protein
MMKSKILTLALLIATTSAASAAGPDKINWQGEVMVTAVSAGCASSGDVVGDHYLAMYQPKNGGTITANSTSNFLTFMARRNAFSLKFPTLTAGVAYTAVVVSGRGHHNPGVTGTIASISTTPSLVAASTPTIVINAQINNWYNTPACTATITGAFVKRVN